MAKISKISSSSEFQKLLSSNTYVITDFYADWCGPCKAIAPVFEQLATSHAQPGKLAFAKVDVDAHQDIAQKYGVSAMPTFLVFTSGTVTDTIRGANPAALRQAVSRAASVSGKASTATFQSKGYTLGSSSTPSRPVNGGGSFLGGMGTGSAGGFADDAVRFMGLYLTTLFSFDGYAAAEASPFKKAGPTRR